MSGGARYWNEETQRWEDSGGTETSSAPATPPPPARPAFAPGRTAGVLPSPEGPAHEEPAHEEPVAGASPGAATAATSDAGSPEPSAPPAGPVGWPGAGGQSGWHGPASAGDAGDAGAWSATEVSGSAPGLPEPGADGGAHPSAPWPGVSWPPAGPAPAAVPPRRMSRRLVWSVLVGAAAVGVAGSLVLTLVVGSGDDKDEPSVAVSGSPSSPPAEVSQQSDPDPTATEETVAPTTSPPDLPAGYEAYEDREGFRIARPKGWTRDTVPSQYGIAVVNYRSADGERRLQIYQVAEESPDASFDLYLSDQTAKPAGFEELSLQNLDDGEFTGSRLEYLAASIKGEPDVGTWHVYDERFVAADGQIYAIAAYGPDADGRDDELELLTTALENFCPPYACDPAAID